MAGINRTTGKATDLITFSRASGGTYLDSDGLLKTASTNIPRIDYDADGSVKGLLIEEQRTNLLTYSEAFDNAAWTKTNCSAASTTAVTDPSGGTNAEIITATSGTAGKFLRQNLTVPSTVTFSVYVKNNNQRYIQLFSDGDVEAYANFDILAGAGQTGTKGTKTTSGIVDVGNDWYRCSATFTGATAGVSVRVLFVDSLSASWFASSTGAGSYYIWGAQLEAGSFPTSYIPTFGATATRAADVASISVDSFGYNQSEGTVVVDVDYYSTGVFNASVFIGNTADRYFLYYSGGWNYQVKDGGATVAQLLGPANNLNDVVAFAWKENDFIIQDGSGSATDTSGTLPSTAGLNLYITGAFGFASNGHIKSLAYYPRRLTNDQLVELTS